MYSELLQIPNLKTRQIQGEEMDRPDIPQPVLEDALVGLARINRFIFTARQLWSEIYSWTNKLGIRSICVLDLGCGNGDVLKEVSKLATKSNLQFSGIGYDNNDFTLTQARIDAPRSIKFEKWIAGKDPIARDPNIVISSLFFHHLDEMVIFKVLKQISVSNSRLLLVSDLMRSKLAYRCIQVGTKALSQSTVVRIDGPRSVEAAFTKSEFINLVRQAGLDSATIRSMFPFRFLVKWHSDNGVQ